MKKIKIAICEDCQEDIVRLEWLIRRSKFCPENQSFFEYLRGENLLNDYQAFDLILIDIHMGNNISGAEMAKKMRKRNAKVIIIFYSAYESKASEISPLRPYDIIDAYT